MNIKQYLNLGAALLLFLLSGCCELTSDDEAPPGIDLRLQFMDATCTDNLFDLDGPLSQNDISFEVRANSQSASEFVVVNADELTENGVFFFSLFSSPFSFRSDSDNQLSDELFIERSTGERETLKIIVESLEGKCGSSSLNLIAFEFKGERKDANSSAVLELKWD